MSNNTITIGNPTGMLTHKPPQFSGEGRPLEIADFLNRMDTHLFRLKFPEEVDKIFYFANSLTDEAATWFSSLGKEYLKAATFEEFLTRFRKQFYGERQEDIIAEELHDCKQTGSVKAYNSEFSKLCSAFPESLVSLRLRKLYYVFGLTDSLRTTVRNLEPVNLEDAMIIASNSYKKAEETTEVPAKEPTTEVDAVKTSYKKRKTTPRDYQRDRMSYEEAYSYLSNIRTYYYSFLL